MRPTLLRVHVGLVELARGRMGDCTACPIHRAIAPLGYEKFTVTEWKIEFADGFIYHVPPNAREFIQKYDAGYIPRTADFVFRATAIPQTCP